MKKNNTKYEILTLGGNCGPRTLLTNWNLIPTKSRGRLSLPFDLSVHPTKYVLKQIEEDFKTYLNGIRYGYKSGNRYYWTNFNDEVIYYHDYINNSNINKILSRYTTRIENFRKLSKDSPYIFYLINCIDGTTTEEINRLYNALKNYRQKPFKFLVWNGSSLDKFALDSNIKVFMEKGPEQNGLSIWDKTRVVPQEEIDYKNKMKQFVIDCIKEEGFEPEYYSLSLKDKIKFYVKWTLPKIFSITNNWVDNIWYKNKFVEATGGLIIKCNTSHKKKMKLL